MCKVALFADRSFIDANGGKAAAVRCMLQRFSIAQEIFRNTAFMPDGIHNIQVLLQVDRIVLDENANLDSTSTVAFLEDFGFMHSSANSPTKGTSDHDANSGSSYVRDWSEVCLAHAFTNIDFADTLGLAWTASINADRRNGGICQAQYRNRNGVRGLNVVAYVV